MNVHLVVGAVISIILGLVLQWKARQKFNSRVNASHGSVAVGGDNYGSIINKSKAPARAAPSYLKIFGLALQLLGVIIMIWQVVEAYL